MSTLYQGPRVCNINQRREPRLNKEETRYLCEETLQIGQTWMPGSNGKSMNVNNQDKMPSPGVIDPNAIGPEKSNVADAQDREWVVFPSCD